MIKLKQYINESTLIFNKEDNPLYYIFIIPKLIDNDPESVKQDNNLKNLLNFIESNIGKLNISKLIKTISPITIMTLFQQETVKKNKKEYIEQYLIEFEQTIAMEEKIFSDSYKIHKIFENIKNSDEYKQYIKTI